MHCLFRLWLILLIPGVTTAWADPFENSSPIDPYSRASAYLERIWELNSDSKTGQFRFRPYKANSIMLWRGTDKPNTSPATPSHTTPVDLPMLPYELKYQLSFKTKLSENPFGFPLDIWFAYTQQSFWQIYQSDQSSPFRETNYEPELILTFPMSHSLLGFQLRMLNIALSHQSNGQANPLSRSWNRGYLQAEFGKGNFLLSLRAWQRFSEDAINDDNPDIHLYMGHGDIRATWFGEEQAVTALARYSFQGNRGAIKVNWTFPLRGHLKGYAEIFSGYGDSLIDYNHNQNTIGAGLLIATWP